MVKVKLRKMLGAADAPYMESLMRLMETQSKETLSMWCLNYAREQMLPIYEQYRAEDLRPRAALEAARECLAGTKTVKEVKVLAKEVTAAAKEAGNNPAAQAAARSIAAAIGALYTVTNPLGMTFYAAAASVYDRVGLEQPAQVYDQLAAQEFAEMQAALRLIAVENEPNPVKLKWTC